MRRLPIDLADLAEAFDNGNAEASFYLDIETGAVVLVMAEMRRIVDGLMADLGAAVSSQETLAAALVGTNMPEWEQDAVLETYEVEMGYGERYLAIPGVDSRVAYGDMEDFIATVGDVVLRERLQKAIIGRGAFRRFKTVPCKNLAWAVELTARHTLAGHVCRSACGRMCSVIAGDRISGRR